MSTSAPQTAKSGHIHRYLHRVAPAPQPAATPASPQPLKIPSQEPKIEEMPANPEIRGLLRRFDCLDRRARVIVESEDKQVALLIVDPVKIIIKGKKNGTASMYCGSQPGAPVLIECVPKMDKQLGTSGEILSIEFL